MQNACSCTAYCNFSNSRIKLNSHTFISHNLKFSLYLYLGRMIKTNLKDFSQFGLLDDLAQCNDCIVRRWSSICL